MPVCPRRAVSSRPTPFLLDDGETEGLIGSYDSHQFHPPYHHTRAIGVTLFPGKAAIAKPARTGAAEIGLHPAYLTQRFRRAYEFGPYAYWLAGLGDPIVPKAAKSIVKMF